MELDSMLVKQPMNLQKPISSGLALSAQIAQIFQDCQYSISTHKKLSVKLWNIHKQSCVADRQTEFQKTFLAMVNRVLPVKKTEPASERVAKYVLTYIEYIYNQGGRNEDGDGDLDMDMDMDMDKEQNAEHAIAMDLVEALVRNLIRGLVTKSKAVRYRSCQLLSSLILSLGEIDDELFQEIRSGFYHRLHDKESSVRVQAVIGLARLQGSDEEDEEEPVEEQLIRLIQHDPKAEVRRTVLLNLEKNNATIPYILERARDVDAITRRSIFNRTLPDIGDFRLLSIGMREKLLSWGLNDRDEIVRSATSKLFSYQWLEHTGGDLLELLERLDIMNSEIADKALMALFNSRWDIIESLNFPPEFWNNLTTETIFLARIFAAYCVEERKSELLEDKFPEVSKLATYIQQYSEFLNSEPADEIYDEQEFILEQLMLTCTFLDFSDEIGRRQMFEKTRALLSKENLPESISKHAVDVFRMVSIREKDFCEVINEIIIDLYDNGDEEASRDDSFHSAVSSVSEEERHTDSSSVSMNSEETKKTLHDIKINLKCLHLTQCALENVEGTLKDSITLSSMLDTLVRPAVRSHEAPIRERGLHCLGLFCLLDKDLARDNIFVFLHCYNKGHESLKTEALHVITDILLSHGEEILEAENGIGLPMMMKLLERGLTVDGASLLQIAAVQSTTKLLLADILHDDEVCLIYEKNNMY
ncbi:nuclear condensing complex subunit [Lipomyces oligophaga]|uniref:nuclear condensing complex subunit n=1 Tax=Lipomyces oligophaga TaxID=45792 RepID=UPI0034CE14D2